VFWLGTARRVDDDQYIPVDQQRRWRPQPLDRRRIASACRRRARTWLAWIVGTIYGIEKTYVELLGRLAQGVVVLLDKVPANLILGQVAVGRSGSGSRAIGGGGSGSCLLLACRFLVLVLLGDVTVGGHDGCCDVKIEMASVTGERKLDRVRNRRTLCIAATGQTNT
jgi:hypothetical protein